MIARRASITLNLLIACWMLAAMVAPMFIARAQSMPERVAAAEVRIADLGKRLESHLSAADLGFERLAKVETAVFEMTWLLRALGGAVIVAAVKAAVAQRHRPYIIREP